MYKIANVEVYTAQKVFVSGVILVRMRENTDQNNSEYGHFLRSAKGIFVNQFCHSVTTII